MIFFPYAKINIGLNVVERRDDGYHNIETVFFPVKGLCDILEITLNPTQTQPFVFSQSGLSIGGNPGENLCVRAYQLLSSQINLPRIAMHLHKQIPFGAGLGGGSSDGAVALSVLNRLSRKPLSEDKLHVLALTLGSDCPFFLRDAPCYAIGRGDCLQPVDITLTGYHILLVNPGIHINTGKAYSLIKPVTSINKLPDLVKKSMSDWQGYIVNDFEEVVFPLYPEIGELKARMLKMGAIYSAMSGSGSTVYGLFTSKPDYSRTFGDYYTFYQKL